MPKCFLAGLHLTPEGVLAFCAGKQYLAGVSKAGTFGTVYDVADGKKTKRDIGVRDNLVSLLAGDFYHQSREKLMIGYRYSALEALYVVGSRNSILKVFEEADLKPEIVIEKPPVYIGVCVWQSLLSDRICVRIKAGDKPSPDKDTKKPHFWDTNVTAEVGAVQDGVSVHPRTFVLPIKNVLDSNKIS